MASRNKVFIMGRLGADPEIRYFENGDPVANMSVATTSTYRDKNGEKQESTEWHRVVCFKKRAEMVAEHLKKGSLVDIEGFLKTRKWDNRDGVTMRTTEIHILDIQFLDPKEKKQDDGDYGYDRKDEQDFYKDSPFDDDVPF